MDGVHDMGGMHGFGPVRTAGSDLSFHEPWEPRAQVLALLSGVVTRARIEELDPADYLASPYYERWLLAAETSAVASGAIAAADLERWRSTLSDDPEALPTASAPAVVEAIRGMGPHQHGTAATTAFTVGDRVRVRRMRPQRHHRCPRYLRGAVGEIERVLGSDPVPGLPRDEATSEPCYTVSFSSVDLFGDPTGDETGHTVLIDLWERYLEEAP